MSIGTEKHSVDIAVQSIDFEIALITRLHPDQRRCHLRDLRPSESAIERFVYENAWSAIEIGAELFRCEIKDLVSKRSDPLTIDQWHVRGEWIDQPCTAAVERCALGVGTEPERIHIDQAGRPDGEIFITTAESAATRLRRSGLCAVRLAKVGPGLAAEQAAGRGRIFPVERSHEPRRFVPSAALQCRLSALQQIGGASGVEPPGNEAAHAENQQVAKRVAQVPEEKRKVRGPDLSLSKKHCMNRHHRFLRHKMFRKTRRASRPSIYE